MRLVVDHVAGSRRGQRQEFASGTRVRFGRHPECEVSFGPHRDIDASSRHAELRTTEDGYLLVDLGSSNGTYVDSRRITEAPILPGTPVMVEFGSGGPRIRLFVGNQDAVDALPPAPIERVTRAWLIPGIVLVALAVGAGALVLALR
ncbi:MAG: FHA domain-containing protein [Proteobacteria bacterium]|nr:FHA domain-containing protein [Pseudomonadota bacterium]